MIKAPTLYYSAANGAVPVGPAKIGGLALKGLGSREEDTEASLGFTV